MTKTLAAVPNLPKQVKKARNAGTPLVAVTTTDQFAVVHRLREVVGDAPTLTWDATRGLVALNDAATTWVKKMTSPKPPSPGQPPQPPELNIARSVDCATTLDVAAKLPANGVLFAFNLNLFIQTPAVRQGVANLRDVYKQNGRTLIALASEFVAPPELTNDIIIFDDPLPTESEVAALVEQQFVNYSLPKPDALTVAKAVDALLGLSAFAVEQVSAMCMTKNGLDFDSLWARKRSVIAQTSGLSVWTGGETFDDIVGNEAIIDMLRDLCENPDARPRVIVWIDEIEKSSMAAGGVNDHEVSRDARGVLLGDMQDTKAMAALLVGLPGGGKSLIAKAVGATFGIPVIRFDLGAMQGSLVGQSQQLIRAALRVVHAIGQHRVLWLATSNDISALPPELVERFWLGTWYFDLLSADERKALWTLKCREYGVDINQPLPNDEGMVGRNIEAVVRYAATLRRPLVKAALNVVPFAVARPETVERLRAQADGTWLSASRPGIYRRADDETPANEWIPTGGTRQVSVE